MRLNKARIRAYRSIIDTGYFTVEEFKTILVGPNEAGKSAVLQALQKLNGPNGIDDYIPLKDYPRSKYNEDIVGGKIDPKEFVFVEGWFNLSEDDIKLIDDDFKNVVLVVSRTMENKTLYRFEGDYPSLKYTQIEKYVDRLLNHFDKKFEENEGKSKNDINCPSTKYDNLKVNKEEITLDESKILINYFKNNINYIEEGSDEEKWYDVVIDMLKIPQRCSDNLEKLKPVVPKFVLFNNYHKIWPRMHLDSLALRLERGEEDRTKFDYGNSCLLKFLGFTARELSNLANYRNNESEESIRKRLDERYIRLNAASLQLTNTIKEIWNPNIEKQEANTLRISADGQYLKVMVEDDLGVEVELDQRSEGFQWIVSFYVVFFAETKEKHKNAILLLDEPGMSLHGLKQNEFRTTLSKLSEKNQTIYTTHSPFLVGSDELEKVRVVEMPNRTVGSLIHQTISASDSAALLPLQEALGYDLAKNLFINERNLILEGLTDYWYLIGISNLFTSNNEKGINDKISMMPAGSASKVSYFATFLHAQNLKVAALLDSDNSGDLAAKQEILVKTLGNNRILRTKDFYTGKVAKCEVEDLLRDTLVSVGKQYLGWDIEDVAKAQKKRPIVDIFKSKIGSDFSKYKLAKAFLKWTSENELSSLYEEEIGNCKKMIDSINRVLM